MRFREPLRLLESIDLTGTIITGDAMFPQKLCSVITDKNSQHKLRREIDRCLNLLRYSPREQKYVVHKKGHRRFETRHITLIPAA